MKTFFILKILNLFNNKNKNVDKMLINLNTLLLINIHYNNITNFKNFYFQYKNDKKIKKC